MEIELKVILLVVSLLAVFVVFIIGVSYIIIKASYELEEIIEIGQLDFLSWVRKNCALEYGEFYYNLEPESIEKLLEIYNQQTEINEN